MITLHPERDHLVLSTKDDGRGFDYKQLIKEGKGLGLKSLQNRANLMHAQFSLESEKGKGTEITIQIPVAR